MNQRALSDRVSPRPPCLARGREPGKAPCRAIPSSDVSKTCLGPGAPVQTPAGKRKLPRQKGGAGLSRGTGGRSGRAGRAGRRGQRAPERWIVPARLSAPHSENLRDCICEGRGSALIPRSDEARTELARCFLACGSGGCAPSQLNPWAPFKAFHKVVHGPGRGLGRPGGGTADIRGFVVVKKEGCLKPT